MLEQMMRQIQELIAEEDFKTQGEAEAFMRGLMAGQRNHLPVILSGRIDRRSRFEFERVQNGFPLSRE